jgi:hypothetical protein
VEAGGGLGLLLVLHVLEPGQILHERKVGQLRLLCLVFL